MELSIHEGDNNLKAEQTAIPQRTKRIPTPVNARYVNRVKEQATICSDAG